MLITILSFKISLSYLDIPINSLGLYLSPECLFNFLSNLHISPCVGKIFEFMFTFLENALNLGIFTNDSPPPYSKLAPKFLSLHTRQREITHYPRLHFFENLFPQQQKGVEETMIYFIKIQSENMKLIWNIRLLIFCMICNSFKCDGFTVLSLISVI